MKKHTYLIRIQYFGYRYHGWQRQTNGKTVQEMVEKTLRYVLGHTNFKILAAGRTDAMVSAESAAFELFTESEVPDDFLDTFNLNLPLDIRAASVETVGADFNVIQDPTSKTYLYLFTCGEKYHPFCASIMTYFSGDLDLDLMKTGAQLMEGEHDYKLFTQGTSGKNDYVRTIDECVLVPNTFYTASFFPQKSYALKVVGSGFMRQQIRLMVGALVRLGREECTLDDIAKALSGEGEESPGFVAPASGLIKYQLDYPI